MRHFNREFFLALTVFSKELFLVKLGVSYVNIYQFVIAAVGIVLYFNPKALFTTVAGVFGVLSLSLALFFFNGDEVSNIFIRQAMAVTVAYVGLAAFLLRCSPTKLAKAYLDVCYYAAVFGIVQFCLSAFGYKVMMKLPLRLDSFAAEPSHYAVAIAPCVYYCLRYAKSPHAKMRSAVILCSLTLTISATAITVFCVAAALAFWSKRGVIAIVGLACAVMVGALIPPDILPEDIADRITAFQAFVGSDEASWKSENLTVLSFATNFEVMWETLKRGRIFGNGFCGHSAAYFEHFGGTEFVEHSWYGINSSSAHCLVIRIVSEFGLPGLVFLCWVLWRLVAQYRSDLWCMFLVMAIAGRALKLGSWIDYGLPVFLLAAVYFPRRRLGQSKPPHGRQSTQLRRKSEQILTSGGSQAA